MDDALREKILASLDPGSDKKSERALERALDRDPVAREYAASLRRVDRALRSWPVSARPESEWEASAARVLAAIEADAKDPGAARVLAGEIDPLAPPAFDDDASPMETRPAMSEPTEHDPDLENLAALTRTSLAPGAVPSVRPHSAPSISDAADDTSSGIVDIKQLSAMARDAAASAPPPAAAKASAEAKPAEAEAPKPAKTEAKPASKKDDVMVTAKPAVPVVAAEPPRRAGGGPLWAIGGMAVMAGAFLLYNSSRDSAPTSPSAVESSSPASASPESVPQAVPSPSPVAQAEPAPTPAAEAAPVAAPAPPPPAVVAPAREPAPEAQARRHARTEASEGAATTRAAAAPAAARPTAPAAPAPGPRPAPAPATTTAAPAAAPRGGTAAAAAPAPAAGRATSVDDLLNRAAPSAAPAAAAAPAAPSADLPERLGRAQITGVLSPLNGAVRSCAQGQTGTAPVAIVIGNDGAVRTATVSGQFAGTPVGDCIAGVVRRAHFPAFRAPTQNLMFPYVITPPTGR